MAEDRKTERFTTKRDGKGWTVYEVWTGQPAVVAMKPQTGLSEDDANHIANLMNRRARNGDRSMRRRLSKE